ncbi:hypothetical protein AAFC00_000151 [Neodothiora populina]|uniref:Zinc finger PHD-type domain-containing protein n=1 Tax=Neodothiora populina TaxID=2781224 RepID=A0ABR3P1K6_9PEZI
MRSSLRARNSPPNRSHPNSHSSSMTATSSSSLSSARPERNTRSHHRTSPRHKSISPASLSDRDGAIQVSGALPLARRSTRQTADDDELGGHTARGLDVDMDEDVEAGEGEDDVTRCVCGHQEYPGPPLTSDLSIEGVSEDAGGLFIQCDKCHVWQHGGCVGIMDESKSPENYFCEMCDKSLHNVMSDSRGQRYSRYLPLYPHEAKSARKASFTKDSDAKATKERENVSRASVDSTAAKRRSTMNSRQTYEDEETLRRVIEESKGEGNPSGLSIASLRKGKRGRDDSSDELRHEVKRQRTNSESPDPPSTMHTASNMADSDDDNATRTSAGTSKKARSVAGESHRQKELIERDRAQTREAQRVEAAGRRQQRAGRRRGDEEAIEDTPKPESAIVLTPSQPPSPRDFAPPQAPGSSHKKGGNRKTQKRSGRNQHTKDRDFSLKDADSPHRPTSQARAQTSSGEDPQSTTAAESNSASHSKNSPSSVHEAVAPVKSKGSKAKGKNARHLAADADVNEEREKDGMSLNDMKKATTLMIDYINKAQIEVTGVRAPATHTLAIKGGPVRDPDTTRSQDRFNEMTSREMMDVLTKQIVAWQREYSEAAPAI